MTDRPPLLGKVVLGRLAPANRAAEDALKAAAGKTVRFELKRYGANERRRAFHFVMLDVAAEALTDATGFHWDAELLHRELKERLGLGETFVTPSGHKVFKPRSTSNRAMDEAERARWTDRCAALLSHWLGVEIGELMNEARARNGGVGPEGERRAA